MLIKLIPQRREDKVSYFVRGDTLKINGETFDFSRIEEGDILTDEAVFSEWVVGPATRVGGDISITLLLPMPDGYSQQQAYPDPITMNSDGEVPLPKSEREIAEGV